MTFYFCTEYQALKLIYFTYDLLQIEDENIDKLIRKYIPIIGCDNILDVLNRLKINKNKKTIKMVENEFKKVLKEMN